MNRRPGRTGRTGCTKRPWLSKTAADRALVTIARDPDRTRVIPVRSYRCDDCGQWHVSAMPAPPKHVADRDPR